MEKQIVEINVQGIGEGEQQAETREIRTGPVSLEEVRSVIDDPFKTNANRVREILGRGSNATIQKHLQQLRTELQREREIETGEAPETPDDVIRAVWVTAWSAATSQVRTRLEQLSTERDSYRETAETVTADADELAMALDEARTLAEQEAQAREQEQQVAVDALAQVLAEAEQKAEALAEQLKKAEAEAEKQAQTDAERIKDMERQAETTALKWEVERQTLRGLNSELQDKLQAVVVERDKIFERVERIQVDADSRVSKIEAAAKTEIAKAQEEAAAKIAEIEAKTKDEIALLQAEQTTPKQQKAKK